MGYLEGFGITLSKWAGTRSDSGRRVTTEYPEEVRPKPERFHGRHVLNRYDDGMEKCIGCELCAGVCPARCIYVRGADNDPDDPTSPGERYGFIYEINYLRCIHCDLCVEACPTEAITETKLFEFAFTNRADAIYTKDELVVDDDGRPQQLPWENWSGGFDPAADTSGWMRATSPSGDENFVDVVAWAGELGYGVRAPQGGGTVEVEVAEPLAPAPEPELEMLPAAGDVAQGDESSAGFFDSHGVLRAEGRTAYVDDESVTDPDAGPDDEADPVGDRVAWGGDSAGPGDPGDGRGFFDAPGGSQGPTDHEIAASLDTSPDTTAGHGDDPAPDESKGDVATAGAVLDPAFQDRGVFDLPTASPSRAGAPGSQPSPEPPSPEPASEPASEPEPGPPADSTPEVTSVVESDEPPAEEPADVADSDGEPPVAERGLFDAPDVPPEPDEATRRWRRRGGR